ncbi:Alpha/Beta hydrolase protein [Microdochium trichocladiopsis]|uniref:Alpha/Beta hydrolase protein n=1 Tax=Microdochium trichocladiopsis TaxID=1682393 RepID=A0A9P8Y625_9PEZI|nr:Alpha/Beta hydrolase protein [Microdochium trichocladiopsis]KAH7030642.1 Alpha/Beta hydrolase protein [Microdochium trichocladiopsis]
MWSLMNILAVATALTASTVAQSNNSDVDSSSIIYQLSTDSEFAFLLEEYLALASGGGSATGEVLRAASQIVSGDYESWYSEFKFLGDAMHEKATATNATRFPVSARDNYFRAASYYRAADFFLHQNQSDPRIYSLWDIATADFDTATSLLDVPPIILNISGPGFTIPAYYFSASPKHKPGCTPEKRPTVIVGSGYDGSQQALYHSLGRAMLERGYNYISYEGPGQPSPRRYQNLGFIPNWWDVVTPVVEYLHTLGDVDTTRIALIGESFGGTLAPRAASVEHRLSAVVAIDGITSMQTTLLEQFPAQLTALYNSGKPAVFDEVMLGLMRNTSVPTNLRWVIAQGMWSFNTESPYTWLQKLGEITSEKDTLEKITCPVLVFGAEHDILPVQQSRDMAAALGDLATYYLFKADVGAGEHCQLGAEAQLAQVTFDWLADVWGL